MALHEMEADLDLSSALALVLRCESYRSSVSLRTFSPPSARSGIGLRSASLRDAVDVAEKSARWILSGYR